VTFHDSFWVLAGTTAPVIALAAVVSARDAGDLIDRWYDPDTDLRITGPYRPGRMKALLIFTAKLTWRVHVLNLILQTFVLALSLFSLAFANNVIPEWMAALFVLLGMLLLALGYQGGVAAASWDRKVSAKDYNGA
jgi:hypothetical protein